MRMRVLTTKLRVEIENETRVFHESLNFEIKIRVSKKSAECPNLDKNGQGNKNDFIEKDKKTYVWTQ